MTKHTRKQKVWSERRITDARYPGWLLRVTEHPRSGDPLYVVSRFNGKSLGYRALVPRRTRADLGKTDKEQRAGAQALALNFIADLATRGMSAVRGAVALPASALKPGAVLTIGSLADAYALRGSLKAQPAYRKEMEAKVRRFAAYVGPERPVADLRMSDLQLFYMHRSTVDEVRTAARGDFDALNIACNFAVAEDLLTANPLDRIPWDRIVSKHTPRRPWATPERYEMLRATVGQSRPARPGDRKQRRTGQPIPLVFGVLLDLAWATGHRISAILGLRGQDVDLAASEACPLGAIRWYAGRAESTKAREHLVPMNALARAAFDQWRAVHPCIAGALLFPSSKDPSRPMEYSTIKGWLRDAEQLVGLVHEAQGGWHMFRRGWATLRKGMPMKDVAAAGGWNDTATLVKSYQHADPLTTLAVVNYAIASNG